MTDKALFLTAYDRPDLLERTMRSWEAVRGVTKWPFFVMIEPGPMAQECLRVAAESLGRMDHPQSSILINPERYGVLHHPWVGFEALFDSYEFVVRAEDDLCVSDDVLEYFDWAEEQYRTDPFVATIHAYSDGPGSDPTTVRDLPAFNPLIWGTWRRIWQETIGPTWDHDYSTFNGTPGNQCVPVRTEILTRRGWLSCSEVQTGDFTIGYNPESEQSEWTEILEVVPPFSAPTVSIFGQHKEFECTAEHKWWVETLSHRTGKVRRSLRRTDALTPQSRVVASVRADTGSGLDITDQEAALLGWVAGDGCVVLGPENLDGSQKIKLSVSQKKEEWFTDIDRAFQGMPHSVYEYQGVRTWYLHTAAARDLLSRVGHPKEDAFKQVLQMSSSQRYAWLGAIDAAEGTSHGSKRRIYQCIGPVSDAIQAAIYLEGWKASRSAPVLKGGWRGYHAHSYGVPLPQAKALSPAGSQFVWCVRTQLGSWTARQDDKVMLTGNSGWDWNLNTRIFPEYDLTGVFPEMSRVDNIGVYGIHGTAENFRTAETFHSVYGPTEYRQGVPNPSR